MNCEAVGFGSCDYRLAVCIGNRPLLPEYQTLGLIKPLERGEIAHIVDKTGNHWRKIFNLYAKLMFQLDSSTETSWQNYRDNVLLQKGSGHTLIFSDPKCLLGSGETAFIISGKSYAQGLGIFDATVSIGDGFYIDVLRKTIVTPYFDYRQLSNRKLDMLTSIMTRCF